MKKSEASLQSGFEKKVTILPKGTEEYISITYGNRFKKMIFLDSYRFTPKSYLHLLMTKTLRF